MSRLYEQMINWRWLALALVAFGTAVAVPQLGKLQIDNSNESFFLEGDNAKARLDDFQATFGNDDFAFLLIGAADAFEPGFLERVGELVERLELEVPHVLEVTWLGTVEAIDAVPGGIVIQELLPQEAWREPEALRRGRTRSLNDPLYVDRLVSADAGLLGVLLEFENYPEEGIDPRKDSPPVIDAILADFDDLDVFLVGSPIMDYAMDARTAEELPVWMSVTLIGMALALLATTRSLIGALVPAVTVVLSVIWTMAIVAQLGFKLNILVILVPCLLLCVGIGDSMHVVAEFRQGLRTDRDTRGALLHTLDFVSWPILLTTITTAAGFLAFLATDLKPLRELGVQAALGVWVALLLTYLFAVPALALIPNPKPSTSPPNRGDVFDRLLNGLAQRVVRSPSVVFCGFVLVTLAAAFGASQLKIETNTIQDLPEDYPLRVAFEQVDQRMGGSMSIELVVDAGRENGIKDRAFLQAVERLQTFLAGHPKIVQASSVLDQIKQMNRAVHGDDPAYDRLPETTQQIAEYLLLYETGGGDQLDQFVSFPYDRLRIQARTRSLTFSSIQALEQDIAAFIDSEDVALTVQPTGSLSLMSALGDYIKVGQGQSFAWAFAAIALIMILSLKSVKLGLLAMVPNVLPVLYATGFMGLMGFQLNMIGLVLAPMILGVAVDDTVHFFLRYRRSFDALGNYTQAYLETIRTVGRPLLFTTLVLMLGFLGFTATIFDGPRNFAWSSLVAFASALLAELLLAPVLLAWLKPLGPEQAAVAATVDTDQNEPVGEPA